jgi:hypothetical protein
MTNATQYYGYGRGYRGSLQERIERYSEPEPNSGCVLWIGAIIDGYPFIRHNGRMQSVTRLLINPNHYALHKCDITSCVNPNHLYDGTAKQNFDDAVKRERRGGSTRVKRCH